VVVPPGDTGSFRRAGRASFWSPVPVPVHTVNRKCTSGLPRWLARVIRNVRIDRQLEEIEVAEPCRSSRPRGGSPGAGTLSWQSCA
jgi:hypothetical protein